MINLVLDSKTLSKITGKPRTKWEKYLEKIKYTSILTLVKDGKLIVILPEEDSPAVKETMKLYKQYEKDLLGSGECV